MCKNQSNMISLQVVVLLGFLASVCFCKSDGQVGVDDELRRLGPRGPQLHLTNDSDKFLPHGPPHLLSPDQATRQGRQLQILNPRRATKNIQKRRKNRKRGKKVKRKKSKPTDDDICTGKYVRPTANDPEMICIYENRDLEKGLMLRSLIKSNLCTKIMVLVTIKYISKTEEIIIIDADLHKQAHEMADMETVSLHYKLGTGMGMNDSMTPTDFSNTFSLTGAREKWVTAVTDLFAKRESDKYKGLYIRWLYPACPHDDCKIGPSSDEHRLIDALRQLRDAWKAKSPDKNLDISMEISAKSTNIYMGLGIEKMSKYLLSYFFILNYEWAEPNPTTAPKTGFQTPISKNNDSIRALLWKNKADNKRFFYGVTTTLIHYVLDIGGNQKQSADLQADEFFVVGAESKYIPFSAACRKTKGSQFSLVQPKDPMKTSYAKSDSDFIPYDETNEIVQKVSSIFETYNNRIGGVWIKNITNDDFEGRKCKCGTFPILRAANEGLYTAAASAN